MENAKDFKSSVSLEGSEPSIYEVGCTVTIRYASFGQRSPIDPMAQVIRPNYAPVLDSAPTPGYNLTPGYEPAPGYGYRVVGVSISNVTETSVEL